MTWKAQIDFADYGRGVSLRLAKITDNEGGAMILTGPPTMVRVTGMEPSPSEPLVRFDSDLEGRQAIQAIIDAAWEYGFRPSGMSSLETIDKAQKAHLEDMRAMIGKAFGVELPK